MLVRLDDLDSCDVILDARHITSYGQGHLPGARHIGLEQLIQTDRYGSHMVAPPDVVTSVFGDLGIDHTKKVVVYGDVPDPSAARVAWTLAYYGHRQVYVLAESMYGLDLTTQTYSIQPVRFEPHIQDDMRSTHKDMDKSHHIRDARSFPEYMAGHIPGAILTPYQSGISPDGSSYLDAAELRRIYGEPTDTPVICYCMHGHRAASLLVQLYHAGYERVSLYDGSFVQWHGMGLPLE